MKDIKKILKNLINIYKFKLNIICSFLSVLLLLINFQKTILSIKTK